MPRVSILLWGASSSITTRSRIHWQSGCKAPDDENALTPEDDFRSLRPGRQMVVTFFCYFVTWVDGELWHGTWNDSESDLRRIDPETGEVLERLEMPPGTGVSGLESDGRDRFFCGGGDSGKVRAVRRPRQGLK